MLGLIGADAGWLNLIHDIAAPDRDPSLGGDLRGRVTHVRDGDTFVVDSTPVRIANLDCAESDEPGGSAATQRMRALAADQEVICDLGGRMSYDCEVGVCALLDGRDVGEVLISEGVCDR